MENNLFDQMVDLYQNGKATVSEGELNPLAVQEGDYAHISQLLNHLKTRKGNETFEPINLAQLSRNGRVVVDSFEKYLSNPATSSSALKQVLKTPLHYYCYINEPQIKKEKKHFELGSFCHLAFLEPDKFDTLIVEPDVSKASLEGIQKHIDFWEKQAKKVCKKTKKRVLLTAKNALKKSGLNAEKIDGKRFFLAELQKRCGLISVDASTKAMVDLIKRHYYSYGNGIIPKILKGAAFETSFYGLDKVTGIPLKVRPDAFNVEENCGVNLLVSFKTTSADSVGKFWQDAAKYQYELSEAMYLEVMSQVTERKFNAVVMIMLQTVAPFLPAVFYWKPDDLQLGKYKFRTALDTVKQCLDSNVFTGYEAFAELGCDGVIEAGLPTYAFKELLPMGIE